MELLAPRSHMRPTNPWVLPARSPEPCSKSDRQALRVPELQLEGGVCRAPAGHGGREHSHGERERDRDPGFLSPGVDSEGQFRVQTGAWALEVLRLSRVEPGCVWWEEAVVFCPLRDTAWEVCVDGKRDRCWASWSRASPAPSLPRPEALVPRLECGSPHFPFVEGGVASEPGPLQHTSAGPLQRAKCRAGAGQAQVLLHISPELRGRRFQHSSLESRREHSSTEPGRV